MRFLVEKVEGEVKHDFSFTLLRSLEFNNWYSQGRIYSVRFSTLEKQDNNSTINIPTGHVPIGSIDFVHLYLKNHYNLHPAPINIPESLNTEEFLGREVYVGDKYDIKKTSFVKSNTKLKGFTDIVDLSEVGSLHNDDFLISEIIEIESEWRGFVHNQELLDIKHYSGNPFLFPDIQKIRKMVLHYKEQPVAYSIDVAILKDGSTVLIECHNFYSLGLYGFSNYRKLPIMFSQWYYQYLRENKILI